jgi:ribosomal protein S12 methylthiotransferase accessory factor
MTLKAYQRGTHRARLPEDTFDAIRPHLRSLGVTRCADITRLDRLGIPTYCSICPENSMLQVTNGKGLTAIDAKVSSLMEAIELFHAEHPPAAFPRWSERQLEDRGVAFVRPERLAEFNPHAGHTPDRLVDWVSGRSLPSNSEVWIPAAAAYCFPLTLFTYTTTGVASGNNRTEAALHALYEVIERHSVSMLCLDDDVDFAPCDRIDLDTVTDEGVRILLDRMSGAGFDLVLLKVPAVPPVHCFMAALIDADSFGDAGHLSFGYGAHLSPSVAASRAITESAQTRLTYIHGARNDIKQSLYRRSLEQYRVAEFFASLPSDASWSSCTDNARPDLETDLLDVVNGLLIADTSTCMRSTSHDRVYPSLSYERSLKEWCRRIRSKSRGSTFLMRSRSDFSRQFGVDRYLAILGEE